MRPKPAQGAAGRSTCEVCVAPGEILSPRYRRYAAEIGERIADVSAEVVFPLRPVGEAWVLLEK